MGKYESKHECAKCGEFVFNETKLMGGFNTRLCDECKNAWDRHVVVTTERARLLWVETEMDAVAALTAGDGVDRREELHKLMKEFDALTSQLFFIGRDWVAAKDA